MVISPTLNPNKLSEDEKIELIKESDGLLIELLELQCKIARAIGVPPDVFIDQCKRAGKEDKES